MCSQMIQFILKKELN